MKSSNVLRLIECRTGSRVTPIKFRFAQECQIKLRLADLSGPTATHLYYAHFES